MVCWTLSSSSFPAAQQLSETENLLGLDGKTWALVVEVTPKRSCSAGLPAFAPEHLIIVTQHSAGPKRFNIFLTPQCCHVVTQLRPVDILRQLLFDASGPDSTAVRAFFQVLREDHSFATALILACSTSVQDFQLADWAARAFFLHGGDVKIVPGAVKSPASSFINLNTTAGLQQSYSTFTSPVTGGFNPNAISTPLMSTPSSDSTEFKFSGRHNDLYLYFGQIIRFVWLMPLDRDVDKGQLLDSIVTREKLINVLGQLNALKGFVHAHVHHQTGPYQTNEKGRLQVVAFTKIIPAQSTNLNFAK